MEESTASAEPKNVEPVVVGSSEAPNGTSKATMHATEEFRSSQSVSRSTPSTMTATTATTNSAATPTSSTTATSRPSPELFQRLVDRIRAKLVAHSGHLAQKENLQKAYVLLGEAHAAAIRRDQLRTMCHSRIGILLSDSDIDILFRHLDPECSGTIRVFRLMDELVRSDASRLLSIPTFARNKTTSTSSTFRTTSSGTPPPLSVEGIEHLLWQSACANMTASSNNPIKAFMKLFHRDADKKHVITLAQLTDLLRNKLYVQVRDEDIARFFRSYSKDAEGVRLSILTAALYHQHHGQGRDLSAASSLRPSSPTPQDTQRLLSAFLIELRRKLMDLVSREGRLPHYVMHAAVKMTEAQVCEFLRIKLRLDVETLPPAVVKAVLVEYRRGAGSVDVKRLLADAMTAREDLPELGKGAPPVQEGGARSPLPATPRTNPAAVEALLRVRCMEKMKHSTPQAFVLNFFFRGGLDEALAWNRAALYSLFTRLDVLLPAEDVDAFFSHRDRGDGKMDGVALIQILLPTVDVEAIVASLAKRTNQSMPVEKEQERPVTQPGSPRPRSAVKTNPMAKAGEQSPRRPSTAQAMRSPSGKEGMRTPSRPVTASPAPPTALPSPGTSGTEGGTCDPPAPAYPTVYSVPRAATTESSSRPKSAGATSILDPSYAAEQIKRLQALTDALRETSPAEPLEPETSRSYPEAVVEVGQVASPAGALSPQRPSTAPPSRSSSAPTPRKRHSPASSSASDPLHLGETVQQCAVASPQSWTPPHHPSHSQSASHRTQQQLFARKFTYAGQSYHNQVDPVSEAMRDLYRISQAHSVTSHADYGNFVANLSRIMKSRQRIYSRQREAYKAMQQELNMKQ